MSLGECRGSEEALSPGGQALTLCSQQLDHGAETKAGQDTADKDDLFERLLAQFVCEH